MPAHARVVIESQSSCISNVPHSCLLCHFIIVFASASSARSWLPGKINQKVPMRRRENESQATVTTTKYPMLCIIFLDLWQFDCYAFSFCPSLRNVQDGRQTYMDGSDPLPRPPADEEQATLINMYCIFQYPVNMLLFGSRHLRKKKMAIVEACWPIFI